jgi:hypothetical protein
MAVPDVNENGFRFSLAATAAGGIAFMRLGTDDIGKCSRQVPQRASNVREPEDISNRPETPKWVHSGYSEIISDRQSASRIVPGKRAN